MKYVTLFLLIAMLLCGTAAQADLAAYFFDVGNADAILLDADGKYMLIDAGTNASASELVLTIKDLGVTRLEYAVGTHPHEDHIGGLDDVLYNFDVGVVIMPDVSYNTANFNDVAQAIETYGHEVYSPSVGDTFQLGEAVATVLSPTRNDYAGLNFFSIVLRVDYEDFSVLLTGDAEDVNEFEMIDSGLDLRAKVLKVGHHGSNTSTTEAFLEAVQPEIAVISCGKNNQYGHPHDEALDRLSSHSCNVLRTDELGTVVVSSTGNWYVIKSDQDDSSFEQAEEERFILNVNTKKFHRPGCSSVGKMKDRNKQEYVGDKESIIGQGYDACKNCDP